MKKTLTILTISILVACNKDKPSNSNENLIRGTKWLIVSEARNGVHDTTVATEHSTLEFRSDGKMYFQQIVPPIFDTVKYEFVNNDNIRITKPWASYAVDANYSIKLLNSSQFDFSLTSLWNYDVYDYKTVRQ